MRTTSLALTLPNLRTNLCDVTPRRPAAPRPTPSVITDLSADTFTRGHDGGLDALSTSLAASWGHLAREGAAPPSDFSSTLFAPERYADTSALLSSGALHDAAAKLRKGEVLPLVQRFDSVEDAQRSLGLTTKSAPKKKPTAKQPKGFFEKAWNVITRGPKKKQPFWKKALAFGGASLAFSLFDYVGFNLARKAGKVGLYRPLQIAAQAGLTFWLKENFGWKTAGAFNAAWWTFNHDFLYYGWAELLNPGNGWDSRGSMKGVLDLGGPGKVTWAWWTPVGLTNLLTGGSRSDPLKGSTLLTQAGVGAAVALTLLALD